MVSPELPTPVISVKELEKIHSVYKSIKWSAPWGVRT